MQRGYIKIWRKLEDSGLLQMHSALAMFLYLIMEAAYKPTRFGSVNLERGQLSSGRNKISKALNLSEQQVRTCLEKLHNLNMITSESTNLYTVYTIVNYNKYQDSDDASNQVGNQPVTNKQPTDNQPITTNKEAKHLNIKEVKNNTSATFVLPDWVDKSHWDLWMQTRKGKKMIPAQMQAQVNKLEKWRSAGIDYAGALSASAENGWTGLFEPKQQHRGAVSNQSENDQIREAARIRIFGEKTIESI